MDVFKKRIAGEKGEWEDVSVEATKWVKVILRSDRQVTGENGSSDDEEGKEEGKGEIDGGL